MGYRPHPLKTALIFYVFHRYFNKEFSLTYLHEKVELITTYGQIKEIAK